MSSLVIKLYNSQHSFIFSDRKSIYYTALGCCIILRMLDSRKLSSDDFPKLLEIDYLKFNSIKFSYYLSIRQMVFTTIFLLTFFFLSYKVASLTLAFRGAFISLPIITNISESYMTFPHKFVDGLCHYLFG